MDIKTFQSLPTDKVAQLVCEAGPKVCVFPANGSRRWFMLEYPDLAATDFAEAYLRLSGQRLIEICKLFFEHGIDTLLIPLFGLDLLDRGDEYVQLAVQGLSWFAQSQDFLEFYDAYKVRVRIYGDTRRYFRNTPYNHVLDAFDKVAQRTISHHRHRLFFGVYAHDATETVAEIGAHFYQEYGHLPNRRQVVEAYYGEYVEPVSLFIGFGRPTAFDMPLLATGNEDLYFTISPSLYLDTHTLRAILYDHLYTRRFDEAGYTELSPSDWQALADFYALNQYHVLGLGQRHTSSNFWCPLPQVKLPSHITTGEK